jgi:hypothetical protein
MQSTTTLHPDSGMTQVEISDAKGDCWVSITMANGKTIEIATEHPLQMLYIHDAQGGQLGVVTIDELFAFVTQKQGD